jgi:hypothetical protein
MLLSNYENAVLAVEKLEEYCLNEQHPIGKHKAKLFKIMLGITHKESEWLSIEIKQKLLTCDAVLLETDEFGIRYRVDMEIVNDNKRAIIRTGWIILWNEDFPRFTTCYIKTKS